MARRKLKERNIRSLTKTSSGRSYTVTLPIEMVRQLKWRERQKLTVNLRGQKIIIEDWPPQKKKNK